MALEQGCFIGRGQVAVVRHPLVEIMGYEVEDILLQVGPGAADNLHFILANQFGQLNTHFGGAHGSGQGNHHFTTLGEVLVVAIGGVDEGGRVEVAEVVTEKIRYLHLEELGCCYAF